MESVLNDKPISTAEDLLTSGPRDDAFRIYLGMQPKKKVYIKNSDGTYSYNVPEIFEKYRGSDYEIIREDRSKDFIGLNYGGLHTNKSGIVEDDNGQKYFRMYDVWDLEPFKQYKRLPKPIRNMEIGRVIGRKPFVLDSFIPIKFDSEIRQYITDIEAARNGVGYSIDKSKLRKTNLSYNNN